MHKMTEDFLRLGATLDFSKPYQPIKKEFMEAEWWLIKKAYEKGRLYQGLRTMHWDVATQSAVAKHELEYRTVTDSSIYMKFPHKSRANTFFIIWTTTPWTIPLNLAIMANPELEYVEADVGGEVWIVARELVEKVMQKLEKQYTVVKKYRGKELEGQAYTHPLHVQENLPEELQKNPRLFTVILSSEYVTAADGTGLVHCAPGCGPEDYEVGHQYRLPPFNCVNEAGAFEHFGRFSGLKAKEDDKKFIEAIEEAGCLLLKEPYVHDYPHGERSHQPVIFRTTKQWFFKVEDLKEKLIQANEDIYWYPESGKNAFRSWLENLRDNSITKQRYWGTPVPIWQAEDGDYIVVGSLAELEALSGKKVREMHIPDIDRITISKSGKIYRRIPDVLDVWIDAGTVSWNCLDYPQKKGKELFEKLFPPDFILEGKDQIRGWYNLLMVASFLALDRPAFKKVYMHGFVTDIEGVKMSKSLGNIVSPYEVIGKHGADVLRSYMCRTSAGEDINFSWEECVQVQRNLTILWNLHRLLLNLAKETGINPYRLRAARMEKMLDLEERYILSRLHSTLQKVAELLESYKLDQSIKPVEDLFLDISRTYIQLVREKSSVGGKKDKEKVLYVLAKVLLETLTMASLSAPFISEAMYLNLREAFRLKEKSISHLPWPAFDARFVDKTLERHMAAAQELMQAALHAREKVKKGLRWPVKEIIVESSSPEVKESVIAMQRILKAHLNVKKLSVVESMPGVMHHLKFKQEAIAPVYKSLTPQIMDMLGGIADTNAKEVLSALQKEKAYTFMLEGQEIRLTREMVELERHVQGSFVDAECSLGVVYMDTESTPELEAEGYAREITRQVQELRKKAGLEKTDAIGLVLVVSEKLKEYLIPWEEEMKLKVGARNADIVLKMKAEQKKEGMQRSEANIKGERVEVFLVKV